MQQRVVDKADSDAGEELDVSAVHNWLRKIIVPRIHREPRYYSSDSAQVTGILGARLIGRTAWISRQ